MANVTIRNKTILELGEALTLVIDQELDVVLYGSSTSKHTGLLTRAEQQRLERGHEMGHVEPDSSAHILNRHARRKAAAIKVPDVSPSVFWLKNRRPRTK